MDRIAKRLLISVLLVPFFLSAQDLNYKIVDSLSYQYYSNQNWKQLKRFGKKALKQGFDYYYLRMRLGIAHYENEKYRVALKHFKKAHHFNSSEPVLNEYLYYSYLFSGLYKDAELQSYQLDEATKEKRSITKPSVVDYINLEGGINFSDDSRIGDKYYASAGFDHRLGKRINVYHAYTFLKQDLSRNFLGQDFTLGYHQHQYYVRTAIQVARQWTLTPAAHLLWLDISDDLPNLPNAPDLSDKEFEYLVSLELKTSFGCFDLMPAFSFYHVKDSAFYQVSIPFKYYPLGNEQLIIGANTLVSFSEDGNGWGIKPFVKSKPIRKLQLLFSYYKGNAPFINFANGFLLENSPDVINYQIKALVDYRVHEKVGLYVAYFHQNRTENFLTFHYNYNSIILGLKILP